MKSLLLFVSLIVFVATKTTPYNKELVLKRTRRSVSNLCQEGCAGDTCYRGSGNGVILQNNKQLRSQNGRYWMNMQADGNLVIYCGTVPTVVWASGTYNLAIQQGLHLQGDGNLVLYTHDGKPVWNSGTENTEVERFVLQNDGNFVGYGKYGKVFWATNVVNKCG